MPRLLDLYCCAGGAAMGYHRAGWDVVGVDVNPQPNYPFEFVQGDALAFLAEHWREFDAAHASPPCQDHSSLSSTIADHGTAWLLPATRAALRELGLPYVIENVPGAPMPGALTLCGTEFGLGAQSVDGWRHLRRHRLFETSFPAWGAGGCSCRRGRALGIYGDLRATDRPCGNPDGYLRVRASVASARLALGIDWMDARELSQAIPPAYTEFIGGQLLDSLTAVAA